MEYKTFYIFFIFVHIRISERMATKISAVLPAGRRIYFLLPKLHEHEKIYVTVNVKRNAIFVLCWRTLRKSAPTQVRTEDLQRVKLT